MTTAAGYDRLINLRDLGGLAAHDGGRTRHGVLLRSEALTYASAADAYHLRHVVGLRTIVDLRAGTREPGARREPLAGAVPGAVPIDHVSLPCLQIEITPSTRHHYYAELLTGNGPEFAGLVRRITAEGTVPVLVHCHLGCDRTGIVIAMLLRLAGVTDEAICGDYARSDAASAGIAARAEAARLARGEEPLGGAFYGSWAIRPDMMADALALVDARWGSMHGWAHAHGLDDNDIDAWKAILVERPVG